MWIFSAMRSTVIQEGPQMTTDEIRAHRAELIKRITDLQQELDEFIEVTTKRVRWYKIASAALVAVVVTAFILIGTVWNYSRDVKHLAQCQEHASMEFRQALNARSEAQELLTQADRKFTEADAAWIAAQIKAFDSGGDPEVATKAQRDAARKLWREAYGPKLKSSQDKLAAINHVEETRAKNPVDISGCPS